MAELDWSALVPRLVHETKVWIIEAMQWIDRPLSARELEKISGGRKSISIFEHHLLSLAKAGGVKRVSRQPVRGAHENRYFFTDTVRRKGHLPASDISAAEAAGAGQERGE